MDESGEARGEGLAPEPSCEGCPRLQVDGDEATCALREDVLPEPQRIFCANHPAYAARDRTPIGPVLLRMDRGVRVLFRSRDSRGIRDKLLYILEDAGVVRAQDMTVRESVALWQLRQFGDSRAHRFVDGIDGVPDDPGPVPDAFAGEATGEGAVHPADSGRAASFVSASGRAKLVVWLLVVVIAVSIFSIVASEMRIDLLGRAFAGEDIDAAQFNADQRREQLVELLETGIWLLTGVVFLAWSHAAYKNLPALGATTLRYSPGWTIGAWLLPVVNLVIPCKVMQELWRKSVRIDSGSSRLVTAWWMGYLAMAVARGFSAGYVANATTVDEYVTATRVGQLAQILCVTAAVLAILVVRGVDARQSRDESLAHVFE